MMLPDNRLTKDFVNINIANLISARGKCGRAKVGCIIVLEGRIISSGFNGPVMGGVTCKDLQCDTEKACQHSIHAEANAISFAARSGIPLKGAVMYCTHGPCDVCAGLIIQSGIKELVYVEDYRYPTGVHILLNNNVIVRRTTWHEPKNNYIKD
jgi:dCMP deaminase